MSLTPKFTIYAGARNDIDPKGYLDIVGHGSKNYMQIYTNGKMEKVSHRIMANLIKKNPQYNGQNIRLLSCSTGACENGFAKNLANKLGVEVKAPNNLLWAEKDGKMFVAPRAKNDPSHPDKNRLGEMKIFRPGKGPINDFKLR